MAEFTKMIEEDYNIIKKPITKRNPQANVKIYLLQVILHNSSESCVTELAKSGNERIYSFLVKKRAKISTEGHV